MNYDEAMDMAESTLDGILSPPRADMCGCSECDWKGKCSDCETAEESEGWEYPTYTIHICPKCEDGGCIDDYWYSDELCEEIYEKAALTNISNMKR